MGRRDGQAVKISSLKFLSFVLLFIWLASYDEMVHGRVHDARLEVGGDGCLVQIPVLCVQRLGVPLELVRERRLLE